MSWGSTWGLGLIDYGDKSRSMELYNRTNNMKPKFHISSLNPNQPPPTNHQLVRTDGLGQLLLLDLSAALKPTMHITPLNSGTTGGLSERGALGRKTIPSKKIPIWPGVHQFPSLAYLGVPACWEILPSWLSDLFSLSCEASFAFGFTCISAYSLASAASETHCTCIVLPLWFIWFPWGLFNTRSPSMFQHVRRCPCTLVIPMNVLLWQDTREDLNL